MGKGKSSYSFLFFSFSSFLFFFLRRPPASLFRRRPSSLSGQYNPTPPPPQSRVLVAASCPARALRVRCECNPAPPPPLQSRVLVAGRRAEASKPSCRAPRGHRTLFSLCAASSVQWQEPRKQTNQPAARSRLGHLALRDGEEGDTLETKKKEKVCFTSSNYHENLVFLPQLRNRVIHLPQLFKPCILPSSSGSEDCFAIVTAGLLQ